MNMSQQQCVKQRLPRPVDCLEILIMLIRKDKLTVDVKQLSQQRCTVTKADTRLLCKHPKMTQIKADVTSYLKNIY